MKLPFCINSKMFINRSISDMFSFSYLFFKTLSFKCCTTTEYIAVKWGSLQNLINVIELDKGVLLEKGKIMKEE